jgi:hypothetical protein
MAINWVSILGKVEIIGEEIHYVPIPITEGPNAGQNLVALVRSNLEFGSGEISCEVYFRAPHSACQINIQPELFAGVLLGGAPYGIASFSNQKWEFLETVGSGNEHPINEWISIKVRVLGSNIDLFINEVKVCSAFRNVIKGQVGLFLQGPTKVTVRNFLIKSQSLKAFIVMQYSDEFNALYNDVIKPTCEKFGYEVVRADDIYKSGLILEDITRSIQEASIVIADITPNNSNVFYEVGYAHGIKKPTILMSERRREALPFDVSGFRTLFYDNTIGGKGDVETRLTKHLQSMANP